MNMIPLFHRPSPAWYRILAWLIGLAVLSMGPTAAQSICVKEVGVSATIDGVVAPAGPSTGCTVDPAWTSIAPGKFHPATSSPKASLYLAAHPGVDSLSVGVAVGGDDDVSESDYVLVYFDATNDDTWNDGDFAIQLQVSTTDTSPGTNSGKQCGQPAGEVTYWYYDETASGELGDAFWKQDNDAATDAVVAGMAYDYSETADDDFEGEIWNVEFRIPTTGDPYPLQTGDAPYFGVGAYAMIDEGNAPVSSSGHVRGWPQALENTDLDHEMVNPNTVDAVDNENRFPDAGDLANASLDAECFDITFAGVPNPLTINGTTAAPHATLLNREPNTLTVRYMYEGPAGATTANNGNVRLRLKPFGTGGVPADLAINPTKESSTSNVGSTTPVEFQLDLSDSELPDGWEGVEFLCTDMYLEDFDLDDDLGNNFLNINYNEIETSTYTQRLHVSTDGIPGLDEGEEATLYLQAGLRNHQEAQTGGGAVPGTGLPILPLLIGFGVAGLVVLTYLLARSVSPVPRYGIALGVAVIGTSILVVACDEEPDVEEPFWQFANAEEIDLRPVEDEPGWYQLQARQGELVPLDVRFEDATLPYDTEQMALEPAEDDEPNRIGFAVKPNEVMTIIANGRIDLDGDEGPLAPVHAGGTYLEEVRDTFLLRSRVYPAIQYAGALIGSFDGFETSFPIGRRTSIAVPQDAQQLEVAVNGVEGQFSDVTGQFDLNVIRQDPVRIPTFNAGRGDGTFQEPVFLPVWQTLTSFDLYTYYRTERPRSDDEGVVRTYRPLSFAHNVLYNTHAQ